MPWFPPFFKSLFKTILIHFVGLYQGQYQKMFLWNFKNDRVAISFEAYFKPQCLKITKNVSYKNEDLFCWNLLKYFNFRAKIVKNSFLNIFQRNSVQFEGLKYQPWLYAFLMMIFKKPSWEVSHFLAVASLKNTYANIWARDFHFMLQLESGKQPCPLKDTHKSAK